MKIDFVFVLHSIYMNNKYDMPSYIRSILYTLFLFDIW